MPHQPVAPASPLAPFFSDPPRPSALKPARPRLTCLAGPSGSGKTSLCQALAGRAETLGLSVAGFLSLPVWDGAAKLGIDLLDLASGHSRPLAHLRQGAEEGSVYGKWRFDPETFAWANRRLAAAGTPDILILDELGPLEFFLEQGLLGALPLIEARQSAWTVVTLRPALVERAVERWPWVEVDYLESIVPSIEDKQAP